MKYTTTVSLLIAANLALEGSAFTPAVMGRVQTSGSALHLLSPTENQRLFDQATDCLDECSLEEVDELVQTLHDQQKELSNRLAEVKKMISALEHSNQTKDRKVDQVRETVRAIHRIFQLGDQASGNDYPALSKPTGYSGDAGKAKTAYDVLNPKKWKP